MKTIVTHLGPDLDAITSVWLVKTFMPEWKEAALAFVPAGKTLHDQDPDYDDEIMHVDTGFGQYDHHQTDDDICASVLIYRKLIMEHSRDPALERLVGVVNDIDHFREVFFPNPTADFWNISIVSQIDGWRLLYSDDPTKVVNLGMDSLDAIYKAFQNKIWAESEIKLKGNIFESKWGQAMAIETINDEVVHLGQKNGYKLVIRKDPHKGYVRIKAFPDPQIDLTEYFNQLKSMDPDATWFLHANRHMILNGTSKNPDMKPTKLPIAEIVSCFKK